VTLQVLQRPVAVCGDCGDGYMTYVYAI